jgi:hypothetical protein
MNQFELCFETKEVTSVPLVEYIEPVPIAEVINFKVDRLSFSADCILSPKFEGHIRYLIRKKREEAILEELLSPDDSREHLNLLLSEYQYLNPLF